ncbi:ACYPI24120 protein [Aphis craccivora]|uniref:ACYPI24120 protein n=1 Tax=Aphis craccivora TaxID=307492 RepID=A0A6G0VRB1_APHCR|nr:ACYPI24120 protein [Aphis craccivora]
MYDTRIHYSKISHTVTDNASNFAKAFRTFSTSVKSTQSTTLSIGDLTEDISPYEDSDVETENITVVDIGQIFTNSEDQNIDDSFCLPPHMRCCAHTLNLISTTDIRKNKDASYIKISESTFKKLFSFWTLISRRTVASDKILEKCGCKFPIPVVTRWNSFYDSSLKVLKYKQQLTKAFDDLHLIKLKLSEWTFLEEYCQVMEPLALSLDKLQDLKYCKPLSFAIIQAIETRFNYILDLSRPESKDFILASISYPKFKLSWFDKDDSDDDFFDSICSDNDFTSPSESESTNSNLANLEALSFLNLKKKY